MTTPEERARRNIDRLLAAAGWSVQSRDALDLGASLGIAVREFPLTTMREVIALSLDDELSSGPPVEFVGVQKVTVDA